MARCIVIGSVAWDERLFLEEPLRPGAHLETLRGEERLGGGGAGVALALAHAGNQVVLVGAVGDDVDGDRLQVELARAGIDCSQLARVPGASTRSVVLVDPEGERTIVNRHRCREPEPPRRLLGLDADCLYVRSRDLALAPLLAEWSARGLVVAHVPPLAPTSRPAHVLVASASDVPAERLARPWALAEQVGSTAVRWIVVTRGARGAEAHSRDAHFSQPSPSARVVDTTGAGDVFAAGLVHGLASGWSMERALAVAVAWGAAAVGVLGLPSRETIAALA